MRVSKSVEEPNTPEDRNRTRRNVVRGFALLTATAVSMAGGVLKAKALSGPWTDGGLNNNGGGGGNCFLAGTMIATPHGDKPVELLAARDVIVSPDGSTHVVRAVRSWTASRPAGRKWLDEVAPIKIARSALAAGVPYCDLYVSANHCLLVDGVLIRSSALVNGRSIVRCTDMEAAELTYYHIELDAHGIVLANGVAAESFLASGMTLCAPLGVGYGRKNELASRARSAVSGVYDVRTTFDRARDRFEVRAQMNI